MACGELVDRVVRGGGGEVGDVSVGVEEGPAVDGGVGTRAVIAVGLVGEDGRRRACRRLASAAVDVGEVPAGAQIRRPLRPRLAAGGGVGAAGSHEVFRLDVLRQQQRAEVVGVLAGVFV